MRYHQIISTPVGPLTVVATEQAITHVNFSGDKLPTELLCQATPLLQQAATQLTEYFAGKRKVFNLPLAPTGTPFQQQVWAALQTIPYGQTVCYEAIAKQVGNPKGCRAVGMANNKNPIGIIIPCHRVVGKNGKLVGYAGGLNIKEYLLNLEQQ